MYFYNNKYLQQTAYFKNYYLLFLQPAVVSTDEFNAEEDADKIFESMDGMGTNESAIIRVVTRRLISILMTVIKFNLNSWNCY